MRVVEKRCESYESSLPSFIYGRAEVERATRTDQHKRWKQRFGSSDQDQE